MCRSRSDRDIVAGRFSDISLSSSNCPKLSTAHNEDDEVTFSSERVRKHGVYHDDRRRRSSSKASYSSSVFSFDSSTSTSSKCLESPQRQLDYYAQSYDRNSNKDKFRQSKSHRDSQSPRKYISSRHTLSSYASSQLPSRSTSSFRKAYEWLPMEYWERSPGCKEAKLDHMDRIDHFCGEDREYLILQTTLWNRYITLELNMFPYETPFGIEHWTLWCRDELSHNEVCRYVENWLRKNMPNVRRWNYDSNSGDRSIDLFHVHVYIETRPDLSSRDSPILVDPKSSTNCLINATSNSCKKSKRSVVPVDDEHVDPTHLIAATGEDVIDTDSGTDEWISPRYSD